MKKKEYFFRATMTPEDVDKLHRIVSAKYISIADFIRQKIRDEKVDS